MSSKWIFHCYHINLICSLKYSGMACDIWEFLYWATQLSNQQISSATFWWSTVTLFRICIKALAMSFPTCTWSKLHNNLALKMPLLLDYREWAFFCRRIIQYRLSVELSHFQGQIRPINSSHWCSLYFFLLALQASLLCVDHEGSFLQC